MVGENVLICDDERLFALDLEKRVESLGYNVCAIAANGEDAVELARKVGPQLALMDIRLNGGLTGIETAQILHDELKIPSIFVSAYSDKETLRQALQPQPLGFLVKPVVDRDLKIAMEVGFSSQQAHQNLEQEVRRYREFFSQSSGSGYVPFHADINTYLAHEARINLLGGVLGNAAHHLNNLWAVVQGCLDALLSFETLQEYERRFVNEAVGGVRKCSSLLNKVLWASEQGCYERKFLNLSELLQATLQELQMTVCAEFQIVSIVDSQELSVFADQNAIKEAVRSLLLNACEAMPMGGVIKVSCGPEFVEFAERHNPKARPGWHVAIRITDEGCGIAPDIRDQIFMPFFSTKDNENRLGLGLSIAHGVARNHCGWVEVDSLQDRGTSIKLMLPQVEAKRVSYNDNTMPSVDGAEPGMENAARSDARIEYELNVTNAREWGYL